MLRFKQLHYGKLFTQGGKGCRYKPKKYDLPKQQGGALGFDGVDYPEEDTLNMYKDEDVKKVIAMVKKMHKVLLGQSAEHLSIPKNKRFVDDLLEQYKQVEDDGWDPNDLWGLYSDFQYSFTDPNQKEYLELPKKSKAGPKVAPVKKDAPVKKAAAVKADTKDIEHKISSKMSYYRMILLATSKKFIALKGKDRTPDINNEMIKIKAKHDDAKSKYDYWKKRMHKVNPDHLTENMGAQIQSCKDELKDVKKELDEANIEKGNLRYELKQCLDSKDAVKMPAVKKSPIAPTPTLKVPDVKPIEIPIEKPVDIDAELARLAVMKQALVTPSLNSYTIPELKAIAKREKSGGVTGLKKKQLIQLIIDGRNAKRDVEPISKKNTPVAKVASSSPPSSSDIKKDSIYINNTVLDLKAMCKELGLTGFGHKNKEQLAMMVKSKAKLPKASKKNAFDFL